MTNKKTLAFLSLVVFSIAASTAQAADQSVNINSGNSEARSAVSCPTPKYPSQAALVEQSGTIEMSYRVLADGSIADVSTEKGWDLFHLRRDAKISLQRCKLPVSDKDSGRQVVRYEYTLN